MSYANNNGTFPTPQYISTIDLSTENKQKFVKYFNYTVFNFAKSFSNPLILPFTINIDVIYHGSIDIGADKFTSSTFAVNQLIGNKFHITGEGTSYFWYRYGIIDPASFNLILQTAISDQNYLVVDALLHTRSITEAIDVIINNKSLWGIIAEGIDWQLNEIGAKDFFAYLTNNCYDTKKLAQFLTILAYIFPDALTKVGIPIYTYDNPNKTFEAYLEYLPTSCIVPIESELSEQSSEISDLFTETSELNNEIIIQMYQIMRLFKQSSEQQSKINEINSEIDLQSSEISDLFSITSEQGIQISDLDVGLISLDQVVNQLSENLILFTNAGKIVDEVLRILHLFKAVLVILKILQHVVKTIAPISELTIISDVGNTLDEILGMTSEAIFTYTSELDVEGIIQHLVNWLNSLLGVNLSVSASSSQSNQSSTSESSQGSTSQSSQSSNNSGGLLGGILGGL